MRTFHFHPLGAAIFLSILVMGVIGFLVVLPIACINLGWNAFVPGLVKLPAICPWQASLLYLAGVSVAFLLGLVHIEFKAEKFE